MCSSDLGAFTGSDGKYVPIEETVRGFKEIIEGKHDDVPERAFYMKGTIDEVVEEVRAGGGEEGESEEGESEEGGEEGSEARGEGESEEKGEGDSSEDDSSGDESSGDDASGEGSSDDDDES